MDYNTHRSKMRMPEYGRNIHLMVEYCKDIADREERLACAEYIVSIMKQQHPVAKQEQANHEERMWDHLAIMSNFELDIDYPVDISRAEKVSERPNPLPIPKRHIPVRHYGNLVIKTLEHVCTMEDGPERDELLRLVANQMKRDLMTYGNAAPDNDRVISDIANFTDGKVQIDPAKFKFDFIMPERKRDKEKDKDKSKTKTKNKNANRNRG